MTEALPEPVSVEGQHARWVDWMQLAGVVLSALAAAVLSYVAQFSAAMDILGLDWWFAALFPFSTDGPMLTASASLWMKAISGTPMRDAKWDWCILSAFALLSTVFNIAHAPTGGLTFTVPGAGWVVGIAQMMAAVPSLALLVSFERLIARLARKSVHPRTRTTRPSAMAAPDPAGLSLMMEPDDDPSRPDVGHGAAEGRSVRRDAHRDSGHDRVGVQAVSDNAALGRRAAGGHPADQGLAGPVQSRPGAAGLPGRGAGSEGAAPEGDAAAVDAAGLTPPADVQVSAPGGSIPVPGGSIPAAAEEELRSILAEGGKAGWITVQKVCAKHGMEVRESRARKLAEWIKNPSTDPITDPGMDPGSIPVPSSSSSSSSLGGFPIQPVQPPLANGHTNGHREPVQ